MCAFGLHVANAVCDERKYCTSNENVATKLNQTCLLCSMSASDNDDGYDDDDDDDDDVIVRNINNNNNNTNKNEVFTLKRLLAQYETASRVTNEQRDERVMRIERRIFENNFCLNLKIFYSKKSLPYLCVVIHVGKIKIESKLNEIVNSCSKV